MAQPRQFQMEGGGGNPASYNDTTLTKIFVGGLAWETQRDTMRRYFEQFGEIVEAVVITDKNTGRSKGYGFVTFKDPESAMRACQNPSPVIDGRRANCNLACLGAQKARPPTPRHGTGRFRATGPGLVAPPPFRSSSSAFIHQPAGQFTFPYSGYGFAGYSQEGMYPLNYYNVYGGQQFSPYFSPSGSAGVFHSFYPFYPQYGAQSSSQAHHGFGLQYTPSPVVQYPYLTQQLSSQPPPPILSLPTSLALASSSSTSVGPITTAAGVPAPLAPPTTTATGKATTAATTTGKATTSGTATTAATTTEAATTAATTTGAATMATTTAAAAATASVLATTITTTTATAPAAATVAATKAGTASGQKQST